MRCGWGLKAGWLIPFIDKRVGGKCDPSLTRATLSALKVSSHEKALYVLNFFFFFFFKIVGVISVLVY